MNRTGIALRSRIYEILEPGRSSSSASGAVTVAADALELNRDAISAALHRSVLESCPHCGKDLAEQI